MQEPQQEPLQRPAWLLVYRVANESIRPLGYVFGACVAYNLGIAPVSHLPALPLWVFGVLIVLGVLAPGITMIVFAAIAAVRQRTYLRSHQALPPSSQPPEHTP